LGKKRPGSGRFELSKSIGFYSIDPAENLMSITTFGEYKPITRSNDDIHYNKEKLEIANNTAELRSKNSRIEIWLFFRN
jgi:hypothetical protein